MLPRVETIIQPRESRFFKSYRRVVVQVPIKVSILTPFMVWWVLWVGDMLVIVDARWDDFILAGTIMSYFWLAMCLWYNWQVALEMWSYFSIFWSIPMLASGVDLILLDDVHFGGIVIFLSVASMMDGFLSSSCKLPRIARYTEEEMAQKKTTRSTAVINIRPDIQRIRVPFILIPLDGAPHVNLTEFPKMSTPSNFRDAYPDDDH